MAREKLAESKNLLSLFLLEHLAWAVPCVGTHFVLAMGIL